jgi:hypothetical protein
MMRLERTVDMSLVKRIATDPRIWGQMSDAFSGKPEDYEPPADGAVYVAVMFGDVARGLFVLVPKSAIRFEVHTLLLPDLSAWRKIDAAAMMREWVWANTKCQRLFTEVPLSNTAALGFAAHMGMKESGREPACFMKDGKLHDVIVLGMNRPEERVSN